MNEKEIKFYDAHSEPFKLYGYLLNKTNYQRIDDSYLKVITENLANLGRMSAGLRIHFKTNSRTIHLQVDATYLEYPHMALTGIAGFDLYKKENGKYYYQRTFIPPYNFKGSYTVSVGDLSDKLTDYVLYFPIFSEVKQLKIGLEKNAVLEKGSSYSCPKRVVFYGSSITQGGCVSRPANTYSAMLGQLFDFDFVNFGFTGSCFAESEMANILIKNPGDIFVYDYDHNARTLEDLKKTHLPFFKKIRESHPHLPIIIISKPVFIDNESDLKRKKVIQKTYQTYKKLGDKNVYFVDGSKFFTKDIQNLGSVDVVHPNDLGNYFMKQKLVKTFKEILNK